MVGGLALGAATGGAALFATNTIGKRAQGIASDDNLKAQASGDTEHFARMGITDVGTQQKMQKAAQKKLASANKTASRSFDLRDTGVGKFASKRTGMDFNAGTSALGVDTEKLKGGRQKQVEHKIEEEQKKEKTYLMSGAATLGKTKEEVAEINKGRKEAYETSLESNAAKEAAKGIVKTFGSEFATDMKKMYTTTGGLAATAAIGAATGGIGLIAAPLAYSLAHAIKTTLAKKGLGDVRSTNAEVIAGVRKTKTKDEQILDILKAKVAEDTAHPTPTPPPAAAPKVVTSSAPASASAPKH
ncbi:MAG: hypothetical protein Q7K54_00100, partial [Candidatus Parcubacteria bacterium]|nr:hypothetical protein [Candidatus Parcubacteria bacterium]